LSFYENCMLFKIFEKTRNYSSSICEFFFKGIIFCDNSSISICYDWNLLHLPKDLFKVWCLEVILWNNTWMNDDDVLKCYSQMLARLPSYVMPTHAANSKIGCEVYVLWENTHFFCPNKLYLYACVFFIRLRNWVQREWWCTSCNFFAFGISHLLTGSYEDKSWVSWTSWLKL
jgi:hypothetical protein